MIATDHKGMFLADWYTEQMRQDMYESSRACLAEIDATWPRAYVLTPPTWARRLDTRYSPG